MKADVAQQRSLLELADMDAELGRLGHRAAHLPEQQRYDEVQSEQRAAADRLAAVTIALEDLDAQVGKLESEVDAVRKREDRDRGLLDSGSVSDPKTTRGTPARVGHPASAGRPAWRTPCWR